MGICGDTEGDDVMRFAANPRGSQLQVGKAKKKSNYYALL
jgi:hypothetical protein